MLKNNQRKRLSTFALAVLAGLVVAPLSANAYLLTNKDDTFKAAGALRISTVDASNSDQKDGEPVSKEPATILVTRFQNAASELEPTLTLRKQTYDDNTKTVGLRQFTFGSEPDSPVPASWDVSSGSGRIAAALDNEQPTAGANAILPSGEYQASGVTRRLAGSIGDSSAFSPFAVQYQSEKGSHLPADNGTECIGGTLNCGGPPSGEVPIPPALVLIGLGALLGHRKLLKSG